MSFAPVRYESDVVSWLYSVYNHTRTETAEDREQLFTLKQKVSELHSEKPEIQRVFDAMATASAATLHALAGNALFSLSCHLSESPQLRDLSTPDFLRTTSPTPPLPSFYNSPSRS